MICRFQVVARLLQDLFKIFCLTFWCTLLFSKLTANLCISSSVSFLLVMAHCLEDIVKSTSLHEIQYQTYLSVTESARYAAFRTLFGILIGTQFKWDISYGHEVISQIGSWVIFNTAVHFLQFLISIRLSHKMPKL